jgi:phage terminase large subunit-like protein
VRADPVTVYARDVVKGKIVVGRPVRMACARHLADLKAAKAKGLEWRPQKAQKALDFFPDMLVLEDGAPFVLVPWQTFVVGSIFGWYKADGFRRFRSAYVETAKGSGKTPLAAGIGLFGLVLDGEPAAEVYSAANDRDQAKIVWKDAWRMVKGNPELDALISSPDRGDVQIGTLTIPSESSVFKPVSAEHKGLDGKRVHMALVDELHEHQSSMVVDKMRAGTKRRQNALIFEITNSGFDRTSVCWEHHDLSIKVLEGTVENDGWFAYICALDPCTDCQAAGKQFPSCDACDDWRDEKVWPKANPSIGTVLPLSYLREQVKDAMTMPSKENIVKRLNFCIWTESEERWLDMEQWAACGTVRLDPAEFVGRPMFAGLDMASRMDLCSAAYLFGPDESGFFDVLMRYWIPEATLNAKDSGRTEADRLVLQRWVDEGRITATEGNVCDYDRVEAELLEDFERYELQAMAFDRWNITQMTTHLRDKLGPERVIDYAQGFAGMSSPSKELEKLLRAGKLRHGGCPVLRWMASNAALAYGPEQQIKPVKPAPNSPKKIDGLIALIMAIGQRAKSLDEQPGVYDLRAKDPEGEMLKWV